MFNQSIHDLLYRLNGLPAMVGACALVSQGTGIPFRSITSIGILAQQLLAPAVDPLVNTLDHTSKHGKEDITFVAKELSNLATCCLTVPFYALLSPYIYPFSPTKLLLAAGAAQGVNHYLGKPLAQRVGELSKTPLEVLSHGTSIALFAAKILASYEIAHYLSSHTPLSDWHVATLSLGLYSTAYATRLYFTSSHTPFALPQIPFLSLQDKDIQPLPSPTVTDRIEVDLQEVLAPTNTDALPGA